MPRSWADESSVATAADAQSIARVHVEASRAAYEPLLGDRFIPRKIEDRREAWADTLRHADPPRLGVALADVGDAVIGFCHFCPSRDEPENECVGEIAAIYVLPDAWRQGAGRVLAEEALGQLKRARFEEATLWVLEANAQARNFYESTGWRTDGAQKHGVSASEVRYRIDLKGVPETWRVLAAEG